MSYATDYSQKSDEDVYNEVASCETGNDDSVNFRSAYYRKQTMKH